MTCSQSVIRSKERRTHFVTWHTIFNCLVRARLDCCDFKTAANARAGISCQFLHAFCASICSILVFRHVACPMISSTTQYIIIKKCVRVRQNFYGSTTHPLSSKISRQPRVHLIHEACFCLFLALSEFNCQ